MPELPAAEMPCAAGVAAEATVETADVAAEVTVLVAGSEAGGVAAEATVETADVAAEVTVLVAGSEAGGVAAALMGVVEGAGVVAGGGWLGASAALEAAVVPCAADVAVEVAAELTADVAAVAVELAEDVTEAVVDVTAEVSVLVTGDAAGPEVLAVEGAVDACACRENTSKTTRIPAASIAHWAARRATRRKASCGIRGSPPQGDGPDTTAHP